MGYIGEFNDSQLRKTNLSPIWRFLKHVIIVCLSARKAGLDDIGQTMQSAMVALVLNKPYNFSRYVFSSMANNVSSPQHKFLMFPRFLQLMMNAQVPDLPMLGQPMVQMQMLKRIFADCRQYGKYLTPEDTPLFGHVSNPNYVAPANDDWQDPPEQAPEQAPQQAPDQAPQHVPQQAPQEAPQQQEPQPVNAPIQLEESTEEEEHLERRSKQHHSSPATQIPQEVNVSEPQQEGSGENASNDSSDDGQHSPINPTELAKLKRFISPRHYEKLQRASQRAHTSSASQPGSSRPAK